MDTTAEMDLIRQKIMAGLGVSEEMLTGHTSYATSSMSSISAKQLAAATVESISLYMDLVTGKVPRDEYVKANLVSEMRKHRGKKRLRKKKAKASLRMRWGFLQFGRLLSRRINYSEIGRKLFTVEPMPDPARPIYDTRISVLDAVAGGEE